MKTIISITLLALLAGCVSTEQRGMKKREVYLGNAGVGAAPIKGADIIIDGTKETIDKLWTYWQGPRCVATLPIKWKHEKDPVDSGNVLVAYDSQGKHYGNADLLTQKEYTDFRLHIEFLVPNKGGNSGVYLQNRFEIQILDGDKSPHGMGAMIMQTESPYHLYKGLGKWNAYDVIFRAARFKDDKLIEQPIATVYFNGIKVHTNHAIDKVWGGIYSGMDGGGGIKNKPGGLKLQWEGHQVMYRNGWIKDLDLTSPNTDLSLHNQNASEAEQDSGDDAKNSTEF